MPFDSADHRFMQEALALARTATRRASPNPGVGCVLVRDGVVIGRGATLQAGSDHAEVQALKDCAAQGASPDGATAYVTLEPCSHHGRTPPCAEALIRSGIRRVVAAMSDPYHEVAGRGLAMLSAAGIEVGHGLLEAEAREVHRGFLSRVTRGRPWVMLKAAATLDGRTALQNGVSQWITGPEARLDVQHLRAASDAILTGSGTVIADNPRLTVREMPVERQPLRVVLDSRLRTDPAALIFTGETTLLAGCLPDPARPGTTYLPLPERDGRADLSALLDALGARGINHLMVEAGAGLNGALMRAGLVDEIVLYQAPMLAGADARGLFDWPALVSLEEAPRLDVRDVSRVGRDLKLVLRPRVS